MLAAWPCSGLLRATGGREHHGKFPRMGCFTPGSRLRGGLGLKGPGSYWPVFQRLLLLWPRALLSRAWRTSTFPWGPRSILCCPLPFLRRGPQRRSCHPAPRWRGSLCSKTAPLTPSGPSGVRPRPLTHGSHLATYHAVLGLVPAGLCLPPGAGFPPLQTCPRLSYARRRGSLLLMDTSVLLGRQLLSDRA